MLAQHLQGLVERIMLHAFGHPVTTCCDMLRVQNRTSAHALALHCCTNLVKRLQHHATSTNVAWKIWTFSNLSQQHPTCRNMSQHVATGWPNPRNMLHPTINVAICWVAMFGSFGRGFKRNRSQQCWAQTVAPVWPPCCNVLRHVLPWRNIVARNWPNDYNIMQHPQMLDEKFDHFQGWANNTQHVATRRKRVANVAPNNVAICRVEML